MDIKTGSTAKLEIDGKVHELAVIEGTEHERAIDIASLRSSTGCITLDDGYGNTGSCQSAITFIDGEKGILRYRGIPVAEMAEKSSYVETAYLLIYGHLPRKSELQRFSKMLTQNENLHEDMKYHFEGFPSQAHPMAILSAMINASSCFYPGQMQRPTRDVFDEQAARLISQVRTIAATTWAEYRQHIEKDPALTRRFQPVHIDEPDMLRFLKSQLAAQYEVIEAVDGQQAVEKASQFLPDIILLDMMMPEKDGLQACREIRAHTPTQNIPVILLTARADEETKLTALGVGASDFLAKPFSTTELHVRIKNLVESHGFQRKLSRQNQAEQPPPSVYPAPAGRYPQPG